eukprot:COSAG01_NODE_71696_length_255_cov_0.660256_1_plen_27_part_01
MTSLVCRLPIIMALSPQAGAILLLLLL